MNKINKLFNNIKNFIKFVASLAVDVVRFVIDRIRNKENTNKHQEENLATRREAQINANKPKPFYQERNKHGFPQDCSKAVTK
tara:strand:+ start:171 stop:419 length:249 start_codon:yes stop_codon:yes gene_type:complete